MLNRRRRDDFKEAVGIFDQSSPVIGEYQVFFLTPRTLTWQDVFEHILPSLLLKVSVGRLALR